MIRTLNGDQLPGLDPFVRVCVASGEEHERRHAAVPVGAGHGCSPDVGHGSRWGGARVDSASEGRRPRHLATRGIYTGNGSRLSSKG